MVFSVLLFTPTVGTAADISAKNGVLDLRAWDFGRQGNFTIKGEFEFYWKEFYTSADFKTPNPPSGKVIYPTPGNWNDLTVGDSLVGKYGYGTARLLILLPQSAMGEDMAMKLNITATNSAFFFNGKHVYSIGKLGKSEELAEPAYKAGIEDFVPKSDTLELIIHLSNYHHRRGGLWQPFFIGLEENIRETRRNIRSSELFLAGCMLIMAIYHLGFYYLRREDKSPLYFALACLALFMRILTTGEFQFVDYVSENWLLLIKLQYLSMMLIGFFLILFFVKIFPNADFPLITKAIVWLTSIICAVIIITPPTVFTYMTYGFYLTLLLSSTNAIRILYVVIKERRPGAWPFFIGTSIFIFTAFYDALVTATIITGVELFSLGAFCFILSQAYMLSSRFSKAFSQATQLGKDLKNLNKSLEDKVEERTLELETSNQGLLEFNQILAQTNNKMTSSINYARRIQSALLVNWSRVREDFPNSFVLFKPKDIVSGDFYWYKQGENKTIFGMLDCTGHGVPGAFMSIIGNEILNKITSDYTEEEWVANQILDSMDLNLRNILSYDQSKVQDGMDMAICVIDSNERTLDYSGAKVPLFYFQNGISRLIKGNKKSIGGKIHTNEKYVNHLIDVSSSTYFYLYSDGYQDQFGGPTNRKFMSLKFREMLSNIHQEESKVQKTILKERLKEWQGNYSQVDDILVMGVGIDLR